MLALSTSWNINAKDTASQINEIKGLGFGYLELCFSHTQKKIKEIEVLSKRNNLKITSLHNYCPIPSGLTQKQALPDCFSLSSSNSFERRKAIKFTKKTILSAKKFKAKAVVLHTGRVQIEDRTKQLIKLAKDKKDKTPEFEFLRELAVKERERNKQKYLDSIFLSLKELSIFAFNLGISLGIENRIYIREIPNFQEIKIFLDNFSKKGVYYWHDTGHAFILEKLGFTKHLDYLKTYKENLLGIHFHDVKDFSDHRPPFSGEIDFSLFKPFVKKDMIKVIEAHQPAQANEIIFAKQELEKMFESKI